MKWTISIVFLLWSSLSFGKQKAIELMKGVVLYLTEDSIKSTEFSLHPNISRVGDICIIDNKIVFGTDFILPETKLSSAYVIFENNKVNLDVSCMYCPNIQSLTNKSFKTEKVGNKLVITGLFSDGAGVFLVQWIVNKKSSIRSIISGDENVYINLFYGHKSPNT
jgi:hypothetical protein